MPGVDLEVWWEVCGRGRGARSDCVWPAYGAAEGRGGRRGGDGKVGEVMVGVLTVEELEVERCCCLSVDLGCGVAGGHDGFSGNQFS